MLLLSVMFHHIQHYIGTQSLKICTIKSSSGELLCSADSEEYKWIGGACVLISAIVVTGIVHIYFLCQAKRCSDRSAASGTQTQGEILLFLLVTGYIVIENFALSCLKWTLFTTVLTAFCAGLHGDS